MRVVLFLFSYANFAKGKRIDHERAKLAALNENMLFKGGPDDKKYHKRVMDSAKEHVAVTAFKEALRKKVKMYLEMHKVKVNKIEVAA